MVIVAAYLALALLAASVETAPIGTPTVAGLAQPVGPCAANQICRFGDPEDLADLAGTPWLIVSETAADGQSGLAAFHTVTGALVRYPQFSARAACAPGGRGGGIGVQPEPGGYRLVRVLHAGTAGAPDAVETIRVVIRDGVPQLDRTACIAAPAAYFLNDIVPMPDGGLAATHMFDRAVPREVREAAFLAGRPTGFVVRWSPQSGWRQLAGTEGSFPNGIAATADGRFLAFAETYGRKVNRIRADGSERLRLAVPMQPDNVTVTADGDFLVAGGTGAPLASTRPCPALRRPGCAFPALAARLSFEPARVVPMIIGEGAGTPGFSVALQKAGHVYLGTAFGDRITIVPVERTPATLP